MIEEKLERVNGVDQLFIRRDRNGRTEFLMAKVTEDIIVNRRDLTSYFAP